MDDRAVLDPTEGERAPASGGERIVVALAGLALAGGLAIAIGNLLPSGPDAAAGPPDPASSSRATLTPRPTAPPTPPDAFVAELLAPRSLAEPAGFSGLVEALVDLPIRRAPNVAATESAVLAAGEVGYAEASADAPADGLEWLVVHEPYLGWVATRDASGAEIARRYEHASAWPGDVWQVIGGDRGFLAIGSSGSVGRQPGRPLIALSQDGASWAAVDESVIGGAHLAGAAWGPAGWIVAGQSWDSGQLLMWQSADGETWTVAGPSRSRSLSPHQLVGSERGYLLAAFDQTRGAIWHSVDGVTWTGVPTIGLATEGGARLVATHHGFVAWESPSWGGASAGRMTWSGDGVRWQEVSDAPRDPIAVAATQTGLIAIDVDPTTGRPETWLASLADGVPAWSRAATHDPALVGGVVAGLAGDGARVRAIGWDRETEAPRAWEHVGHGWTPIDLPAEFIGLPRFVAAGGGGYGILETRWTEVGPQSPFWRDSPAGGWTVVASPLGQAAIEIACGPPPSRAVEMAIIDRTTAAACFGADPITLRAWSIRCEGCPSSPNATTEPDWLLDPMRPQLYLSPMEGSPSWLFSATIPPGLAVDPAWQNAHLEITGHFDDPAAAGCRAEPSDVGGQWYQGRAAVVAGCRSEFVVDRVSPVPHGG